ncbi:MAG: hypothetical protein DRP08_04080 [Candidatus Aenigmatarchaeota archaeon]|nr:MAG: hypothetical protein DRP08_04080 [Candidatus Aenigmarchaeota archaeon]
MINFIKNLLIMEERRRYIRFNVPLRAEIVLNADIECVARGEVVDFSRQGVRVKFYLPKGSLLREKILLLKIYLPNRSLPIEVEAETRWFHVSQESWELGLKIRKIDATDKAEILEYAYKLWRKEI